MVIWKMKIISGNLTKKQLEFHKDESRDIFRGIENYFKTNIEGLVNSETIIIKQKRSIVWNIISDWNLFKNYVPFIAEAIVYEGKPEEIGTKITIKWNTKNVQSVLLTKRIEKGDDILNWEIELEMIDGFPKAPSQNILFSVIRISEKLTFVNFSHIFQQSLSSEYGEALKLNKNNILKTLKKNLENK